MFIVPLFVLLVLLPVGGLRAQAHPDRLAADSVVPAHGMMMTGALGIPPAREGSGTSWLPDVSPMYALHAQAGHWALMLHGNAFLYYIHEGSDRGDDDFGSINWIMGMARRQVLGGQLGLRAMLSAEPFTLGACGYPDLLATGEFCEDLGLLHDRQHPHDLFMELSAQYQRQITHDLAFQLYGGPVAEPALGPSAFPHRVSALPNPFSPISHHWFDATHIAFGVITGGLFGRQWKLEGSLFNGREPDANRYDFDFAPLDSYAGRLSFVPSDRWALQVSAGHLEEAEVHELGEPREDVDRITASATYHRPLGSLGIWASTFAWGRNIEEGERTDAFLLESSLNLDERNVFFGRGELAEKTGGNLVLEVPPLEGEIFTVGKLQLGYIRQFGSFAGLLPGIGASMALDLMGDDLEPFYGESTAFAWSVFASIRPAPVRMNHTPEAAPHHGVRRGR